MAYPKLTPVTATGATAPRYLGDRFADMVNVKDYGAKGDGTTDDTAAFAAAALASKNIFVPSGTYKVSSAPVEKLYGYGTLKYDTGHLWCVRNPSNVTDLSAKFKGQLDLSSGKVPQDISICDGYLFVSQNISGTAFTADSTVRITRFAYNDEDKDLDNLSPELNAVASDALTAIDSCDFVGLGHGEGCAAIKKDGQIYVYAQLNPTDLTDPMLMDFAKITWNGSSSTYTAFRGLKTRGQMSVSVDGKYLIVCRRDDTSVNIMHHTFVYDLNELETSENIGNVNPIYEWGFQNVPVRSGIACDGKYVYILASTGNIADTNGQINIFAMDGTFVKKIPFNHMTSILIDKVRYGWNGRYALVNEVEGIAIYKDKLVTAGKIIWGTPQSVVTLDGGTFIAISDIAASTLGPHPLDNGQRWVPTLATISGASAWSKTSAYTGATDGYSERYLVSIECDTKGFKLSECFYTKDNDAELILGDGQANASIGTFGSAGFNIGRRTINTGKFDTAFYFYYSGYLELLDARSWQYAGYDELYKHSCGHIQYDAEEDEFYIVPISGKLIDGVYSSERQNDLKISIQGANSSTKGSMVLGENVYIQICPKQSTYNPGCILFYGGSSTVARSAYFNGSNQFIVYNTVRPNATGTISLGASSVKWSNVYADTGPWASSDERLKENISTPSDNLIAAWGNVGIKVFQFKDAVAKKGQGARIHLGVIAQDVMSAFEAEGIDVSRYGLFGYDEWEDEYEDEKIVDSQAVYGEKGEIVEPEVSHIEHRKVISAGNAYSIRYEEALVLECAYLRSRISKMQEQIDTLTQRVNQLTNNTNN